MGKIKGKEYLASDVWNRENDLNKQQIMFVTYRTNKQQKYRETWSWGGGGYYYFFLNIIVDDCSVIKISLLLECII